MALLIEKRLDKKGGGGPPARPPLDDGDGDEGMDQESVENSAIADFMAAKSPEEAKAALKQFLEACYPQLAGDEEEMPEPEPEA
jgi:hypothetical protein